MNFLFNNTNTNPFISVYTVGYEETKPSHNYCPAVRSGYMLHYVYSGKGTFICKGKSYDLHAGDFFFISPDNTIQYMADQHNPWAYYWFGFRGDLVQHYLKDTSISSDNPVFSQQDDIKDQMSKLIEISLISENNDMLLNACLLEILYQLSQIYPKNREERVESTKNITIAKAMSFIKNNFDSNIRISDIATHLNIDRSYLHRLFVSETGQSPKQFLTQIRLRKAKNLLKVTDLPVKNIAYSSGFEDYSNFSKSFKNQYGMTALEYRKISVL